MMQGNMSILVGTCWLIRQAKGRTHPVGTLTTVPSRVLLMRLQVCESSGGDLGTAWRGSQVLHHHVRP